MTTNNVCENTPQPGNNATSLFFTKAPGEDYYKVYARYGNDPAWVPLHLTTEARIDLQQVRDADRNITTNSGSYDDAHVYLRSADGNNMTTALFANAAGGGIQTGNADGLAPLNLQPEGGTLTYGGDEVATKDWVDDQSFLTTETEPAWNAAKPRTLTYMGLLPNASNLNNYVYAGIYYLTESAYALAGANYPIDAKGILEVTADGFGAVYQTFHSYAEGEGWWMRGCWAGWWSSWQQMASREWVNTATIKNQNSSVQTANFRIDGYGQVAGGMEIGEYMGVYGGYSEGAIYIYPHSINASRGGNTFTLFDFQGAHSGSVFNTMDTAPFKFRYNNDWDRQMVFDQNLMIGVTDSYVSTGDRLQVNGSIKQSAVTSSLLKADADGKIIAAAAGTDYATLTKGVATIVGDGFTTSFTIPHGLGVAPEHISLTPKSAVANKMWFDGSGYVPSVDATDITVDFVIPPVNGVSYDYWWAAHV